LPLYLSEWSSQNPAFIAQTAKSTIGLADILSYWTFDEVYEELGVPKKFLNKGFGLIGQRGVPRPSYYTFTLLHELGEECLESEDGPLLATRRKDGSIAVLVWNLIPQPPGQRSSMGDPLLQTISEYEHAGKHMSLTLTFEGAHRRHARIKRVDANSGNFRQEYEKMGSPAYPTVEQIAQLKHASGLSDPETVTLNAQKQVTITIPPNGVALVELS
jgi:xylan 1,4-beta-xylosidase